jgi:hypothetical protein
MDAIERETSKVTSTSSSTTIDGSSKNNVATASGVQPMTDEEEWDSMYA